MSIKFALRLIDDTKISLTPMPNLSATQCAELYDKVVGFPEAKYDRRNLHWIIPLTSSNIEYLNTTWQKEEYEVDNIITQFKEYKKLDEEAKNKKNKRKLEFLFHDVVPDVNYDFFTEPRKHQIAALDALHNEEYFALLAEMGTGKTKIVLDEIAWVMRERFAAGNFDNYYVLLFAPKSICLNWRKEFLKHFPPDIEYDYIRVQPNTITEDLVSGLRNKKTKLKFYALSYDTARNNVPILQAFIGEGNRYDLCICDESTYIKSHTTKRTKALFEIRDMAHRRIILTGSPNPNSVLDLWAQYNFLQPGSLGYLDFEAYKRHYADIEERYGRVIGEKNMNELKKRMADCSFVIKKSQCLDLPEKTYTVRSVEMGPKQTQVYTQMARDFIASLEDKSGNFTPIEAQAIVAQLMKLAQICGGFCKDKITGKNLPIEDGDVKIKELEDIISELDPSSKFVIWARFREDITRIHQLIKYKLKINCGIINGETPERQRFNYCEKFNTTQDFRCIIGEPLSAGLGLDMLGTKENPCTTVIYYSNDFSLLKRIQSEDRSHRTGMHCPVTYIDLVCENTIEEKILQRLQEKKDVMEMVKDISTLRELVGL